jgi:hypothetical protein
MTIVRITEEEATLEPLMLKPDILHGERYSEVVGLFQQKM